MASEEQLEQDAFHAREALNNPAVVKALDEMDKKAFQAFLMADTADHVSMIVAQCMAAAVQDFRDQLKQALTAKQMHELKKSSSHAVPGGEATRETT